ncbi:MAG: hypothetical protein ACXWQR_15085 [Ktedonobacterales bacterium]
MADIQTTTADSTEHIRTLLVELQEAVKSATDEIQRIAELEVRRHGDDTVEGIAWCDFGANGLHSDVAHAARKMQWEIAAMRGSLIYHGLDGLTHT